MKEMHRILKFFNLEISAFEKSFLFFLIFLYWGGGGLHLLCFTKLFFDFKQILRFTRARLIYHLSLILIKI